MSTKNLLKLAVRDIIGKIVIDDDDFYGPDCRNNRLAIHIDYSIVMNDNIDCAIVVDKIMAHVQEDTFYMASCHKSPTNILYVIFPTDGDALFFKMKIMSVF